MNERLVDAIIQGGALGAALFLVIFIIGRKVDRLAELVYKLPERIGDRVGDQISRIIRQTKCLILIGCLSVTLSGCVAAGQGAAAGAGAAITDRALPPAPYSPATDPGNWLVYTVVGLAVYAAGSAGKGWIRSRMKPPLPDIEDET